ncbi:MAG: outer membrane beta-barrel protein [Alphaproteobacteria bacterium]
MTSFLRSTALAAVFAAAAFSADAADITSMKDAPSMLPVHQWSHSYLGIHLGYGWGKQSSVDYATPDSLPQEPGHDPPYGGFSCAPALVGYYCGTPFKYDVGGVFTGLQAGHNWQRGVLVFGVEGDFGNLNISKLSVDVRTNDTAFDEDVAIIDFGWYGTITGRIGLARGRSLFYLKGGLAMAEITHTAYDLDDDDEDGVGTMYAGSYTTAHSIETGWAVGGGIEHAISDNWSVKAEYLYMDFGSKISDDPDCDLYKHESKLHMIKAALNYQFHRHPVTPLK